MKKFLCWMMIFLFSITFISACGPSEEAIATMTASAWTPTPEPTLTPTPLPYDLEVTLQGESGESVFYGAYVTITEQEEVMAGETGKAVLMNLPGPEVEVSIIAQGYNPHTETVTLERGMNAITLTLIADPLQVNPATACQEGQKVLYIEDFEDKLTQEMVGITRPIFDYEEVEERGTVLTYSEENTNITGTPIKPGTDFGNFVWKFDTFNENALYLNIHQKEGDEGAYMIHFIPSDVGVMIFRMEGSEAVNTPNKRFIEIEWTNLAIAFFDNAVEVYVNNELYMALDDPDPLPPGGIYLEIGRGGSAVSFDNMVICELTEPYAPPVTEENVE